MKPAVLPARILRRIDAAAARGDFRLGRDYAAAYGDFDRAEELAVGRSAEPAPVSSSDEPGKTERAEGNAGAVDLFIEIGATQTPSARRAQILGRIHRLGRVENARPTPRGFQVRVHFDRPDALGRLSANAEVAQVRLVDSGVEE